MPASYKGIVEEVLGCALDTGYEYILRATGEALARRGHPAAADLIGGEESRPRATVNHPKGSEPSEVLLNGDDLVAAVGESHYQDALRRCCGARADEQIRFTCRASLVPEPDNRYDANAVAVHIDGTPTGYLARADAAVWQPILKQLSSAGQVAVCDAMISGRGAGGGTTNLGVFLHLPSAAEARIQIAVRSSQN